MQLENFFYLFKNQIYLYICFLNHTQTIRKINTQAFSSAENFSKNDLDDNKLGLHKLL